MNNEMNLLFPNGNSNNNIERYVIKAEIMGIKLGVFNKTIVRGERVASYWREY